MIGGMTSKLSHSERIYDEWDYVTALSRSAAMNLRLLNNSKNTPELNRLILDEIELVGNLFYTNFFDGNRLHILN